MSQRISWEQYALLLAKVAARRSQDPYMAVGCCALRHDRTVAAVSYNGPPPGIEIDWRDRDDRRPKIQHAEMSCLRYCKPGEIGLIAITHSPCSSCLTNMAGYGIKRIVYELEYVRDLNFFELAKEFGIEIIKISAV
jgi:dCMP deaminase